MPLTTRQIYSNSSENLLKEYGLDFSQLSVQGNGDTHITKPCNNFQSQSQLTGYQPEKNVEMTTSGGNTDPFADLDPLRKHVIKNPKPKPPPRPSHVLSTRTNPPPRPSNPPPVSSNYNTNCSNTTTTPLVDMNFASSVRDPSEIQIDSVPKPMSSSNVHSVMPTNNAFGVTAINAPPPPMVPPRTRRSLQNPVNQSQSQWTTFE